MMGCSAYQLKGRAYKGLWVEQKSLGQTYGVEKKNMGELGISEKSGKGVGPEKTASPSVVKKGLYP